MPYFGFFTVDGVSQSVGATTLSFGVRWSPPNNDGGYAVEQYQLQGKQEGYAWADLPLSSVSDLVYKYSSGVPTDTKFTFRVKAMNSLGWGAWGAEFSAVSPGECPKGMSGPESCRGLQGLCNDTQVQPACAAASLVLVAPTPLGLDSRDGKISPSGEYNPLASLKAALSKVGPGGTLLLYPGTYHGADNCGQTVAHSLTIESIVGAN
jgi:hypothetical protein